MVVFEYVMLEYYGDVRILQLFSFFPFSAIVFVWLRRKTSKYSAVGAEFRRVLNSFYFTVLLVRRGSNG